jgi:YggT family protein
MEHMIIASGTVLQVILNMLQLIVLASVLVSWVGADPYNPIVKILRTITEPLYAPIRKLTRNIPGPLDLAPLVLILIIIFLQTLLNSYLRSVPRSGF